MKTWETVLFRYKMFLMDSYSIFMLPKKWCCTVRLYKILEVTRDVTLRLICKLLVLTAICFLAHNTVESLPHHWPLYIFACLLLLGWSKIHTSPLKFFSQDLAHSDRNTSRTQMKSGFLLAGRRSQLNPHQE